MKSPFIVMLCAIAIALLVAAKYGVLTDRGGGFVVAAFGIALVLFHRPIAAWSHSVGRRHLLLAHWQKTRPFFILLIGFTLIVVGVSSAFE